MSNTKLKEQNSQCNYHLYGLCFTSQWPIPCPQAEASSIAEVELFEGSLPLFSEAERNARIDPVSTERSYYGRLSDGAEYVRWNRLFEFVISADGRSVASRPLAEASWEAFETYLLGQVLSYSLIKLGIEPLHATVLVVDGEAVVFIGDTGYGKSSLAAAFLQAGDSLLTDDLLVIKQNGESFLAYPGPPRIKLFPEVAQAFLGRTAAGAPMNPYTRKLVIPLGAGQSWRTPTPIRAIYVLGQPAAESRSSRIVIVNRPQFQAFLDLISNTYNTDVTHPRRLAQQFAVAAKISASIPFKSLTYPPDLSQLANVVEAIREDLS